HSNLEALTACLDHAAALGAERHAFLGDLVGYGADPVAVLELVQAHAARGAIVVLGNHDAAALGRVVPGLNGQALAAIAWTRPRPGTPIPTGRQRRWLAIVGSAGQPRDRNTAACYALADLARERITFFRVPYDFEAAAQKIRTAGLPERLARRLERGV